MPIRCQVLFFFFKVGQIWGLNSQPGDQKLQALLTEPGMHLYTATFNKAERRKGFKLQAIKA